MVAMEETSFTADLIWLFEATGLYLGSYWNHLESFKRNTDAWVPLPEILIWLIWSSAQASGLLRTPQVMLICSQGLGTGPGT